MNYRRRRRTGQFAKGNRGGPGRPKTPTEPAIARPPAIANPDDLRFYANLERQTRRTERQFAAMLDDDAKRAWQIALERWPRAEILRTARRAKREGLRLPAFIAKLLRRRRRPK